VRLHYIFSIFEPKLANTVYWLC